LQATGDTVLAAAGSIAVMFAVRPLRRTPVDDQRPAKPSGKGGL